eukprot:915463-Prorocentrum_minimum.AAC.2
MNNNRSTAAGVGGPQYNVGGEQWVGSAGEAELREAEALKVAMAQSLAQAVSVSYSSLNFAWQPRRVSPDIPKSTMNKSRRGPLLAEGPFQLRPKQNCNRLDQVWCSDTPLAANVSFLDGAHVHRIPDETPVEAQRLTLTMTPSSRLRLRRAWRCLRLR